MYDRVHALRLRLEQYRIRHAAILKQEEDQKRIEHAEAETRRQLLEEHAKLTAGQSAEKEPIQPPPPPSQITTTTAITQPQPFRFDFATAVTEEEAIHWLKHGGPSSSL
ncbi:hypothetical protein BX666DRAFT_1903939 [Dichotomocladium elegans]|nr:hypothetical protein BX666DRAFT_1903939 [Dichotomocladium elegans]